MGTALALRYGRPRRAPWRRTDGIPAPLNRSCRGAKPQLCPGTTAQRNTYVHLYPLYASVVRNCIRVHIQDTSFSPSGPSYLRNRPWLTLTADLVESTYNTQRQRVGLTARQNVPARSVIGSWTWLAMSSSKVRAAPQPLPTKEHELICRPTKP